MKRSVGYSSLLIAAVATVIGIGIQSRQFQSMPFLEFAIELWIGKLFFAVAILAGSYGIYTLVYDGLSERTASKRRQHDIRNVLRLVIGVAAMIGLFGLVTEQWIGVLFSLGIVGFAVTFALQQPLFSLIGWVYIMVKRPYGVGDRVAIEDAKGDVISVDFFVTTLWEINGQLVSSNQPSGRIITVPNSVVLSSHVYNYSWEEFPYIWNEISFQVAYETDMDFVVEVMREEADGFLGDEMASRIDQYRSRLDETPIELEVQDRPSVNITQKESWVELRLRYLVHPKRGQRVKNELYRRILSRFNEYPDRVNFPVGRPR